MKRIRSIRNLYQSQAKGQGLVETAIIAPILIFMLIGVFEVGWALRGYLVLTNVNRETTRFSVRPGYLNYNEWPDVGEDVGEVVGYYNVVDHMFNSLSQQLDTTDTLSPAMVVSHLAVNTGWPCDPETTPPGQHPDNISTPGCDCRKFDRNDSLYDPNFGFTKDDEILHPGLPAYEDFYAYTYDPVPTDTITYTTTYSYAALAQQLADENNLLNCQLLKRTPSATPAPNYVVLIETWYGQPQLFGFPLISNPVTDPVPMFGHTMMRIPPSRSGDDRPGCKAYPFIVRDTNLPAEGATFDILDGADNSGDVGWLAWNPDMWNTSTYLVDEMKYPELSVNDFTDVHNLNDHTLSVGDYVASLQGVNATVESSDGMLTKMIGQKIRIPVWTPPFHNENINGYSARHYLITGFIWVRIESSAGFSGPPPWPSSKNIYATYLGDASKGCPTTD